MKRILPWSVACACVAPLASAQADIEQGQLLLNPGYTQLIFDGDRRPEDADGLFLGLEYRFSPKIAAELSVSQLDARVVTRTREFTQDYTETRLDAIFYPWSASQFQPYVTAGFGSVSTDISRDGSESTFALGIGTRFQLSRAWYLRWDVRVHQDLDHDHIDGMSTFGISYLFNSGPKQKGFETTPAVIAEQLETSEPVPEVEVVDATMLDYDGDGIIDRLDKCPDTPSGVVVDKHGCLLDSDGDGIADEDDQCPTTTPGNAVSATGCALDSDNDGVADDRDQCPGTRPGSSVTSVGCEGIQRSVVVESVNLQIRFASGSAVLAPEYYVKLEKIADFLNRYSDLSLEIEGYSDNQGDDRANLRLSQRRAESVRQALIDRFRVAPGRVTATGYGEQRPVATNDTAAGREQNRRVVAVVRKAVIQ